MRACKASVLAAIVGCGLLVAVGTVSADTVIARASKPPVGAKGLTAAERKALTLVSVKATGVERVGVIVKATFAGNIEQVLGRGHLVNGLVAVVLRSNDASVRTQDVATLGAGAIGQTLAKTHSIDAAVVVRKGRSLSFVVAGVGFSHVSQIEVKVFATFPTKGAARSAQVHGPVTAQYWDAVEKEIASVEERIPAPTGATPCSELQQMQSQVSSSLLYATQRDEELKKFKQELEKAVPELEHDLLVQNFVHAGTTLFNIGTAVVAPLITFAGGGNSGLAVHAFGLKATMTVREEKDRLRDAIRGLKLDVRLADAMIAKNKMLVDKLNQAQGKIDAFITINCKPVTTPPQPPPPPPPPALFKYHFDGLTVQFTTAAPQNLTITQTFSGDFCGSDPLKGAWTISFTEPPLSSQPITETADFSATNPFTAAKTTTTLNEPSNVIGTATSTLQLIPGTPPQIKLSVTLTGGDTSLTFPGPTQLPITVTPVTSCP